MCVYQGSGRLLKYLNLYSVSVIAKIAGLSLLLTSSTITCASENTSKIYTNNIGMEFVLIPAGTFMMGSDKSNIVAADNEKPRHTVSIERSFYISRFEVTQEQWKEVMGSSPFTLSRSNSFYSLPGMAKRLSGPTNPATVSWNDAQEFIKKLNQREGIIKYRLPSEAEWEYAARAGSATDYSFGNDTQNLGRFAWYGEDFATGSTHPVGQKEPNPWGIYDVHGNVWEWVHDWYDSDYYSRSPTVDPFGPDRGSERVVRGGSWHASATSWRTAFRRSYSPDYRGISIGFRVVSLVKPQD